MGDAGQGRHKNWGLLQEDEGGPTPPIANDEVD